MPEPREYLIIRNLQAALQAIHRRNGYHYTVARTAVKLDPNEGVEALIAPDGPRPFVVIEVLPERWEYWPNEVRIFFPLTIHWVSETLGPVEDLSPLADEGRLRMFFRGCADVEQAMAVDVGRGNLATDTRVMERIFDTSSESTQVWAQIKTEIRIYRTYGQPNS